jgi:hypothetical protein
MYVFVPNGKISLHGPNKGDGSRRAVNRGDTFHFIHAIASKRLQ